uniref:ditrans,polycis-polyprenyl diphosphate synthase [(2E,6E)-farnesyldiphosphate specific] n=1 Tax=Cynoglossus semilaevis TaxID=244447 RepID=A0A3P8WBS9_CYNSE
MVMLYGLLWRLLLLLVHVNRALVSWLRVRLQSWKSRLWERAMASLLLPLALAGFPEQQKKLNRTPGADDNPSHANGGPSPRLRYISDGMSLQKLPVHIGFLVTEEEPSYTDIANLVVWCMAVGISYISVYDNHDIFQKNHSRLLKEIERQQRHLMGGDGHPYNVEFLSNGSDKCHNGKKKSKVTIFKFTIPDPELVVKFGPVDSTLGFLPWHIRLTEFIFVPSHRDVSYKDLLGALKLYSSCQQRVGQ